MIMRIKSYGIIAPTGTYTFTNLINLDTYPLEPLEIAHLKIMWHHYLQTKLGLCETGAQRIINSNGYLIPSDWLERHATLNPMK